MQLQHFFFVVLIFFVKSEEIRLTLWRIPVMKFLFCFVRMSDLQWIGIFASFL